MPPTPKYSHFTRDELAHLFATGKRVAKTVYWDILQGSRKYEYGRILVITRSTLGSAVARNKIRRQIKSLFYENGWFKKDHDTIIIVKKEALKLPFKEIEAQLRPYF